MENHEILKLVRETAFYRHPKNPNIYYINIDTLSQMIDDQEKVVICPECLGTGNLVCRNVFYPDHGFIDAIGAIKLSQDGHPCDCSHCENEQLYSIPNTICKKCNGTGKA